MNIVTLVPSLTSPSASSLEVVLPTQPSVLMAMRFQYSAAVLAAGARNWTLEWRVSKVGAIIHRIYNSDPADGVVTQLDFALIGYQRGLSGLNSRNQLPLILMPASGFLSVDVSNFGAGDALSNFTFTFALL